MVTIDVASHGRVPVGTDAGFSCSPRSTFDEAPLHGVPSPRALTGDRAQAEVEPRRPQDRQRHANSPRIAPSQLFMCAPWVGANEAALAGPGTGEHIRNERIDEVRPERLVEQQDAVVARSP